MAQLGARFHGMEDSIYNLQTSTLKTKDLEYSELLRKCSGQGRTNDVTAPNCSDNLASKSTRRGCRPGFLQSSMLPIWATARIDRTRTSDRLDE